MEEKNQENIKISDDKIMFIYGKDKVDGKERDGQIEELKLDKQDDGPHYVYLAEYLESNLKDKKEVQDTIELMSANPIFYEIQKLGHICIAENTTHENSCILYMPKQLTQKQEKSLKLVKGKMQEENYKVTLLFDLDRSDGLIEGKQKIGEPEIINHFLKNENSKENR